MNLSASIISAGTGCRMATACAWLTPLETACDRFGITSPEAIAALLANIGVESASLTVLAENMNYSAQGLADTWPQRFAIDPKAKPYRPNDQAIALAYKPQTIANTVYANRMGNGNFASGDGWTFRGQGPIQVSGRLLFTQLAGALGLPLVAHPELLQQPQAGALSASWFFHNRGCTAAAESGDFAKVVKLINGAPPSDANQGDLRAARYRAVMPLITSALTSPDQAQTPELLTTK
jgi:putative chitinase